MNFDDATITTDRRADSLPPNCPELNRAAVADVISWNLRQMDGLTGSPPFQENANLFGGANCRIMDWRTREVVEFITLTKGAK